LIRCKRKLENTIISQLKEDMNARMLAGILIEILKPTWMKIGFFVVFAFIWIGGVTQTYTFIKDVLGIEKPPLYDLLKPYDFWSPWIFFSAPFYILVRLLCSIYDFCSPIFAMFPDMGGVKFPLAGITYSYMASAWMAFSWEKWFRSRKNKSCNSFRMPHSAFHNSPRHIPAGDKFSSHASNDLLPSFLSDPKLPSLSLLRDFHLWIV